VGLEVEVQAKGAALEQLEERIYRETVLAEETGRLRQHGSEVRIGAIIRRISATAH
jgi:hypothetical protein